MTRPTISSVVHRMLSAGCPPDAIIDAVRLAEAALLSDVQALDKRRKWDRTRKKQKRVIDRLSAGQTPLSSLTIDSDSKVKKESKRPPMKKIDADLFGNLPPQPDDWPADYAQQFWDRWPRHQRKHSKDQVTAKLARIRRDRRASWAEVWGGLCAYMATNPEVTFIPAPLVWLNGQRWMANYDVVMTARAAPERKSPMLEYAREQLRNADQSDDAAGSSEIARPGNSG